MARTNLAARLGLRRDRSTPSTPSTALARVGALADAGRLLEAVDLLAEANGREASSEREHELIELRRRAVSALSSKGRSPWPPRYADPAPGEADRLPEVDRSALGTEVLGGAVAHHGALLVRNLFEPAQVSRAVDAIDRVDSLRRARKGPASDDRWYRPFPHIEPQDKALRRIVADQGGTWLADSPAATALILDELAASGATGAIAGHFGERPLFSLQKSTLRRSEPVFNFSGWHQDGSFLGPQARSMNVWVALTRCGGDHLTPGLELVPKRIEQILATDGGLGSASIADASVARAAGGTPTTCPEFAPGDAILFDERFLHRTHLVPDMTHPRYALECWFFAPSFAAESYVSFVA